MHPFTKWSCCSTVISRYLFPFLVVCCCQRCSLLSSTKGAQEESWNLFNSKLLCCSDSACFSSTLIISDIVDFRWLYLLFLGAQIIDLMMLVVDVVKGVQTQTAECLLIGELTCPRMVVILNKIDLLPPNKRQSAIEKMTKKMHRTLQSTRSEFITV